MVLDWERIHGVVWASTWFWGSYFILGSLLLTVQLYFPQYYSKCLVKPRFPLKRHDILKMYGVLCANMLLSMSILYHIWWLDIGDSKQIFTITKNVVSVFGSLILAMVWFHYTHWWCHRSTFMYRNVHYLHHTFTPPCAPQALYVHPVEMLVVFLPAAFLGPYLCEMNSTTYSIWNLVLSIQGILSHSGLDLSRVIRGLPSSFPLLNATRHDMHHRHMTINFGPISSLDRFHHTEHITY